MFHTPHVREDSLIVYGIHPQPSAGVAFSPSSATTSIENTVNITTANQNVPQVTTSMYEIIFTRETPGKGSQQLFSLCRSPDLTSATQRLKTFHSIIPTLSAVCPNLVNQESLQDICNYLDQYPKHSLAHVAAHFAFQVCDDYSLTLQLNHVLCNLMRLFLLLLFQECFKHASIQQEAATGICPDTSLTPLHLAIKSGRLNLIQTILAFNPKLDVRDRNGSNVLHFAASTSKDIISLICSAILSS